MELSPEEYGEYWRASLLVSAGVLIGFFGSRFAEPFLSHSTAGARILGGLLFVGIVIAASYLVVLGFARVIRTALEVSR